MFRKLIWKILGGERGGGWIQPTIEEKTWKNDVSE
jgi:hypothetical protein